MWEATLKDGSIVKEGDKPWKDIKEFVAALRYTYNDVVYTLPSGLKYFCFKTASVGIHGGSACVESTTIGYYHGDSSKIGIRFMHHQKSVYLVS